MRDTAIRFLPLILGAVLVLRTAVAQVPATIAEQLTTPERIEKTKFWPTDGKAARDQYLGSKACALCHNVLVQSQLQHSMAKASVRAESSPILADHADTGFHIGD